MANTHHMSQETKITNAAREAGREDFRSNRGIARWWSKDGAWHVSLPCAEFVDGLKTGGFRYIAADYRTREEAIEAIKKAPFWRVAGDTEEIHQFCGFMAVLGGCGSSKEKKGKFWWNVKSTPIKEKSPTGYCETLEGAKQKVRDWLQSYIERMLTPNSIQ